VEQVAQGIRERRFEATPSTRVCQYCAYAQICPFTATRE
jgi:CRISPR/Cas system-associated exonuclease Cas4 (RecB family)